MSFALMLAAASLAGTAPPPNPQRLAAICHTLSTRTVASVNSARIQPLGDQPPAQQIKAVLRTTADGCITPIVVRAEVGRRR